MKKIAPALLAVTVLAGCSTQGIREIGPIDRIVVRPIEGDDEKYVVVEGNRRIGA